MPFGSYAGTGSGVGQYSQVPGQGGGRTGGTTRVLQGGHAMLGPSSGGGGLGGIRYPPMPSFGGGGGGGPISSWGPYGPSGGSSVGSWGAGGAGGGFPPGGNTSGQLNTNVQRDQRLDDMYDAFGKYRGELAAGSDADAQLAMGRQRDLLSGLSAEFGQNAASSGTYGTGVAALGQQKLMTQGARTMGGLNAQLTADARNKQLQALQGQTGAAQANANYLTGQQNYALNQWQAMQGAYQNAQQLQAQQQQNQWNNQMQLLNMFYTG